MHVVPRNSFAFVSHMHDALEIVYLTKGTLTAKCCEQTYSLSQGDLFITFPNQPHAYAQKEAAAGYIAIFSSDILKLFGSCFNKIPKVPFITGKELSPHIPELFEKAADVFAQKAPFKEEELYALMILLLAQILKKTNLQENKTVNMDTAARLFAYCNENFCEDICLDSTASALAISKHHILRIFREKLNTTFQGYIHQLRIEKARQLLEKTSASITEISIQTGYNTIRSFNRVFLAQTGLSPTQYRKHMEKKKE